jgi:hypothetical protein
MRILSDESLYSARRSEPCLNARGERLKVTDALDLVVWEFHVEVIFKACEKFESLEAVDPELLIDIVTRLQFGPRKLEMGGGEIQDFVGCLFDCFHDSLILYEHYVAWLRAQLIKMARSDCGDYKDAPKALCASRRVVPGMRAQETRYQIGEII